MKLGAAIAEIMKREGIEILCGYPVNHLIEYAADADIRPVMVRQERIGVHMADAISRVTSGQSIGAFCMQHGPGAENAMGGVAQCYGESVPVLVLPMGYARRLANIDPNFNSSQAMKAFSKSSEPINIAAEVCNIFRRAFTKLKNGRGGPVIVEIPADMWNEEVPEPLNYTPVLRTRYGADPVHVKEAAALLVERQAPGDLCRPGRALRQSVAAAEAAGRAPRHPRHDQPWRQVVLSGDASAVAGIGRPRGAARGAEIPGRCRRDLRHRLLVHRNLVRHRHAEGQDHHPFDARPQPSQQGCRGQNRPGRRCRARPRRAAGRDRQDRHEGSRRDGGRRRDRGLAQGMAGEVDAEADA